MPVDLSWRSVKMRIERSHLRRGMCSTSGDPLGATYYLAKSKAHQVEHVLPIGLNTFLPVTRPQPLPPGGRWVMEDGRLMQNVPIASGGRATRAFISPGLQHSWPVFVMMSDQVSQEYAQYIQFMVHYGYRCLWFHRLCHLERMLLDQSLASLVTQRMNAS